MTARELAWLAGAPVRASLLGAIGVYRAVFSGWLGGQCRFSPTCSQYAQDAIRAHGALRGSALAVWRIARCNPYGRGGFEPVPPARHPRGKDHPYDGIAQAHEEASA